MTRSFHRSSFALPSTALGACVSLLALTACSSMSSARRPGLAESGWTPRQVSPDETGSLEVRLEVPIERGVVRVALYDSEEAFDGGGRPAFGGRFGPGERILFEGLPPGTYALRIHHDEDEDGTVNPNFLSIPTEPLGFGGGYRPAGRPRFAPSCIEVDAGGRTVERVTLRRVLGDQGTIGVGVGSVVQSLPYRGASGTQVTPIPLITFVSENFALFGPQLQYSLSSDEQLRVAATLRARFPAYQEDDAEILEGLGDRDLVALGGLQLEVPLGDRTALRVAYEHDVLDTVGGGEASAFLRRDFQWSSFSMTPELGVRWTAGDLVDHDFGVPTSAATPSRPAYAPSGALFAEGGITSRTRLSDRWQLIGIVNVQVFDGEVTDSPLVDDDFRFTAILGLTYSL